MTHHTIEINCDLGEGYGRWAFAPDEQFMPHITTANIACGFHAGDPRIMRDTVAMAMEHGLQIGAHVSLPDIVGFGRRRFALTPEEMRDNTIYQIGALKAFVEARGGTLAHVKPHGVMYAMIQDTADYADAVTTAIAEVDKSLLFYALDATHAALAASKGITLVPEGFVDLHYDAAGGLMIERVKQAWDPEDVAARAIRLVTRHEVVANDGTVLPLERGTICLHGDAPNSTEVISTVRHRLDEAGIETRALAGTRA